MPRRFALRDVDAFFARRVLLLLLLRSVEREREKVKHFENAEREIVKP